MVLLGNESEDISKDKILYRVLQRVRNKLNCCYRSATERTQSAVQNVALERRNNEVALRIYVTNSLERDRGSSHVKNFSKRNN